MSPRNWAIPDDRDGAAPRLRRPFLLHLCLAGLLLASACSSSIPAPQNNRELTIAAASDLQSAFQEIGRLFEQDTGAKVTFLFGSSGNLEKQIENGAPMDLFASAGEEYVQQLQAKGQTVTGTEQLYGLGRLVLVSSKAIGVGANRPEDLLRPEVKHLSIANPDHAPYGVAARQALTSAGLWDQLKPKIVYGGDVRQALQYVQTGNAEAGLVALSLADVPEVDRVAVADSLYQPLRQTMAVVKGTKQEQLAREFAAFVNGTKGRPIMKRYGFALPGES
jgi:molybdate transport system substrate-binding protein